MKRIWCFSSYLWSQKSLAESHSYRDITFLKYAHFVWFQDVAVIGIQFFITKVGKNSDNLSITLKHWMQLVDSHLLCSISWSLAERTKEHSWNPKLLSSKAMKGDWEKVQYCWRWQERIKKDPLLLNIPFGTAAFPKYLFGWCIKGYSCIKAVSGDNLCWDPLLFSKIQQPTID